MEILKTYDTYINVGRCTYYTKRLYRAFNNVIYNLFFVIIFNHIKTIRLKIILKSDHCNLFLKYIQIFFN